MTDIKKLERKLNQIKNKIGLVGGAFEVKEYNEAQNYVSAHINPQGWKTEISLRKGFVPIITKRQKAYAQLKGIEDGLETLLEDISCHEFAHWEIPFGSERGCPYDIYNHDKILEAVKHALPNDKKQHAGYVANAFEDLIINPRVKEFKGDFAGQVLFWDWQGLECKEKGLETYTPFYEAFVKLNLHLFGDAYDTFLLKEHFSNDKKVQKAMESAVKNLSLQKDIVHNGGTSRLFEKNNWSGMAGIFAKDLADLLETSPKEKLSAYSNPQNDDGNEKDEPESGNGVEEKINTREGKEEVAYGRYSNKESQSSNITSYEQLDSLYRKLARDISVKVEAMTREQSLALGPLNFRAFNSETDDLNKLKFSKLFVTDEGINFGHQRQPLVVSSKSKIQARSFPDFKLIVIDNSGSMKEGLNGDKGKTEFIPWGNNSKYHYALLGFYGIENFLQNQGIAQYIGHGLSLFSSTTKYKEGNFQEIEKLRKLALAPEFGITNLDAKILTTALKGKKSFVLSLSDGEIGNWNSEKDNFKELVKDNYFAHIQLGGSTSFTNDLESWGLPVFPVTSGADLSKLMVDVTRKEYERFTKK